MEKLEEILYSPLMEEESENNEGWSKETVSYVVKHKNKVERQIRSMARGIRKQGLQSIEVDDIYSELLFYLYKAGDYDISKAISRASSSSIVSLEGYLNVCIKYCVIRYCSNLNAHEKETVSETVKSEDDKELSIFNTIADERSEITLDNVIYDLNTICKSCEPLRYRFGPDIYLIWYVRLLTATDTSGNSYKDIMGVLGITKKDLSRIEYNSDESVMYEIAKAVSLIPTEEAIQIIGRFVYSAGRIKSVVNSMLA